MLAIFHVTCVDDQTMYSLFEIDLLRNFNRHFFTTVNQDMSRMPKYVEETENYVQLGLEKKFAEILPNLSQTRKVHAEICSPLPCRLYKTPTISFCDVLITS